MYREIVTQNANIKLWDMHIGVEQKALQQLFNTASLPIVHGHVAVMPDVHFGMGATVGSVIPTKEAIIPAAVGVDIGCGMCAVKTSLTANDLPDNLVELRSKIERTVPLGFNVNSETGIKNAVKKEWCDTFETGYNWLEEKYPKVKPKNRHPIVQLGTLGGGNHFIEVCLDTDDNVWLMLHSGSRGIGNKIGTTFINIAKEEMLRAGIGLADKNLSYLKEGTESFEDYVIAVSWAQDFAAVNRKFMLAEVLRVMHEMLPAFNLKEKAINCHHNYVSKETYLDEELYITRKGAVSAKLGELGIIPGSMGAKSFIVSGLGNEHSFNSCSHGAGRVMSRSKAKTAFTVEDHIRDTDGVECRKDKGVLDETPRAYKNIEDVMASQSDLVEVVATLKQILCVKG